MRGCTGSSEAVEESVSVSILHVVPSRSKSTLSKVCLCVRTLDFWTDCITALGSMGEEERQIHSRNIVLSKAQGTPRGGAMCPHLRYLLNNSYVVYWSGLEDEYFF